VLLGDGVVEAAPESGSAYGAGRLDELLGGGRELKQALNSRLGVESCRQLP
jgi:hypothetical protein